MKDSTSKEKVLKKVRAALINQPDHVDSSNIDFEKPIYHISEEIPEIVFAQKFTALTGKFAYCDNKEEFTDLLKELILEAKLEAVYCSEKELLEIMGNAGIKTASDKSSLPDFKATVTSCEFLISRTGSIMVSSMQASGRQAPVSPDIHIVVAYTSQMVEDIKDGLKGIKDKYGNNQPSLISLITGPSRTADIEKTLILGAHGPKEIYCFLIAD
jgi:L-lactate dehydrogenase complex protein LldG